MTTTATPACQWCGAQMQPSRQPKRFCHAQHRAAFHEAARRLGERLFDEGAVSIEQLREEGAPLMPTTRCAICRYHSQRDVRQVDFRNGGRIEALCLSEAGPHAGQYTGEDMACGSFKAGLCAVDDRRAAA